MIVVTGGAGFIGSNIVKALNDQGHNDILVVDDLTDGRKFKNIANCKIADYIDKDEFLLKINNKKESFEYIKTIFHQGACSTTTEWNGKFMMQNNYEYSKAVLNFCLERHIPFIYASSAAIYGNNTTFKEELEHEAPINVYGYSKFLFDQYVREILPKANCQIVGLRYFNVYGPYEFHKGSMASIAFHLSQQLLNNEPIKLFEGSGGYTDGEQQRDFVYVDDAVAVNLWFYENANQSGIFNVGTGRCQSFNDVAHAVINWHGKGKIEYIPFPEKLKNSYQSYTQADITKLREIEYDAKFKTVEQGVKLYLDWMNG